MGRIREGHAAADALPTCKIFAVGGIVRSDCYRLSATRLVKVCRAALDGDRVRNIAIDCLDADVACGHHEGGGGGGRIHEEYVLTADDLPFLEHLTCLGGVCGNRYHNAAADLGHGCFVDRCGATVNCDAVGVAVCLDDELEIEAARAESARGGAATELGSIDAVDECLGFHVDEVLAVGGELDSHAVGLSNLKQCFVRIHGTEALTDVDLPAVKGDVAVRTVAHGKGFGNRHSGNGVGNGDRNAFQIVLCSDRSFKNHVGSVFTVLQNRAIHVGVVKIGIVVAVFGKIEACARSQTDACGVGLTCFKNVRGLEKRFALVPADHLAVEVIPLVGVHLVGGGSADHGMRNVGIGVGDLAERCRDRVDPDGNSLVALQHRKGHAGKSVVLVINEAVACNRPLFKELSLGVGGGICNHGQDGAG